jgi:DNA helicase-2/ATP-dependent DNA helicase PcrA
MSERADQLLDDLTEAQREAVTHFEGPLLILAGAGSGKTRVITRRVAWLLREGVRPNNILAITFTNKAAGEMRERVEALVPASGVWISTFHRFGARLLRQYADRLDLDRDFTIYDQSDRARLVKLAIEDVGLDAARFTPDTIVAAISKAKNQLLSPSRFADQARGFYELTVAQIYPAYEKRLRDANALDFDDLLYWPALALKNDPDLRTELDARFRFLLIDEYQDTNPAQYAIARGLSSDHPNLCVVGDPDQSIYAFRSADIRNILNFERDFPSARVLLLGQNYRSTKAILHAASHLIAHNRQRKPKDLFTDNPHGQPVSVLTFETGTAEAEGVVRRIRTAVEAKNRSYRDFAIFVRINALTRELEKAFVKAGIPFQIVKGLAFFDRKENRDIVAYLRLLLNPRDDLSFLRVANEPPRGIGKVSLDHLAEYAAERQISLLSASAQADRITPIKGKAATALREFAQMMDDFRQLAEQPPDEVIRQVLDRSGYRRMLKESNDPEDQDRLANIEELITAARQFAAAEPTATVRDFLENITLASDVDSFDQRQDSVSIMTMHAAKGLEFPVVYMVAVEQGILPHGRSIGKHEEVEEERRLAFVGMTRAMEELYLCHALYREFRGETGATVESMFLRELPGDAVQLVDGSTGTASSAADHWRGGGGPAAAQGWDDAGLRLKPAPIPTRLPEAGSGSGSGRNFVAGMRVRHPTYGLGRIIEVSGVGILRRVRIRFNTAGERTFIADKVTLEILSKP